LGDFTAHSAVNSSRTLAIRCDFLSHREHNSRRTVCGDFASDSDVNSPRVAGDYRSKPNSSSAGSTVGARAGGRGGFVAGGGSLRGGSSLPVTGAVRPVPDRAGGSLPAG
jgi:hypothetical protein